MGSELVTYFRIVLKRWWLILLILIATSSVILYSSFTAKPVYRAYVKLQVIAPESQEVSLFSQTRSASSQEEIVAVERQFDAALRSAYVAWQTIADLNLGISAGELLNGLTIYADGEFLNVTFVAENPMLVESIATAHVQNAFNYYAQMRSKPSSVALEFIQQQLAEELKALSSAGDAALQFKINHNLDSLPREISAIQDQLRVLRLERSKLALERAKAEGISATYMEEAAKATQADVAGNYQRMAFAQDVVVAGIRAEELEYDALIGQQESTLEELLRLTTEYDDLMRALSRVQANYSFLADKENEAKLKQSQAMNVSFVQIIEPARMPDRPAPSQTPRMLAVGAIVSLLAGIILAFVLEFISSLRAPPRKESA